MPLLVRRAKAEMVHYLDTGIFKALKSAAALLMAIDPDTDVSYVGFNYSKSAVCVLLRWSEWKLCAAFPSRGGPGPPSKQTPTWCGAKWGGTRSTVSPHSECFVLDEAPIVVLGSQPHVTCLEMRKALASWVLSAWGGPAVQDTNITSESGKKDILWSSTKLFLFSKPQNISASVNTRSFSFPLQSWFLLLQPNNNWVTNKAILVLIGQVLGISIPVPLNVRRCSS